MLKVALTFVKETQISSITQTLSKSSKINIYTFPLCNNLELNPTLHLKKWWKKNTDICNELAGHVLREDQSCTAKIHLFSPKWRLQKSKSKFVCYQQLQSSMANII